MILVGIAVASLAVTLGSCGTSGPAVRDDATPPVFEGAPARGPFASERDFCAAVAASAGDECLVGAAAVVRGPTELAALPAEVRGVTLVSVGAEQRAVQLGIATREGWFFAELAADSNWAYVDELARRQEVPGGAPEIVAQLVYSWMTAEDEDARWVEMCSRVRVVCGLPATGAPMCTKPVETARATCDGYDPNVTADPPEWD
jgi:hypothetical protein